jgi:hypothetical protein
MSTTQTALSMRCVGYQVRTSGGGAPVGEIEGVRARGVRLHRLPAHPGRHGYLPSEAVSWVSDATNTVFLKEGITPESVVDAPPPPDEAPGDWHKSSDWWADLLGHFGLFESEGRGNEPFLHPDQR